MRRVYGIFLVAFREASWNFPRQDHDSKEFRGFPGMELGIFRAAKSSGEGRRIVMRLALLESHELLSTSQRGHNTRRACPGTVKINKEKIVEEYKDLYHYVSLINGKLKKNVQTIDIIKSMMPGGSVIGCPKINTLNLLNHQEKEERNIYTGSFGYIMFNGDMKFNIIIRSILYYKNVSEISVASGVVIDSNAKNEFNENFIKAKALIDLYK